MNKQEYKEWYRGIRVEAREIARTKIESGELDSILTIHVPYFTPITTNCSLRDCDRWGQIDVCVSKL